MLYTFYSLLSWFFPLSIRPFQILRLCHVCDFYFHRGVKKYDFNETEISKCRAY